MCPPPRLALLVGLLLVALVGPGACRTEEQLLVGRWMRREPSGLYEECAFHKDGTYTLASGIPEVPPDRHLGRYRTVAQGQGRVEICVQGERCADGGAWRAWEYRVSRNELRLTPSSGEPILWRRLSDKP